MVEVLRAVEAGQKSSEQMDSSPFAAAEALELTAAAAAIEEWVELEALVEELPCWTVPWTDAWQMDWCFVVATGSQQVVRHQ